MPVQNDTCKAANLHAAGSGQKQRAVKHASLLVKVLLFAMDEFNVHSKAVVQTRPQLPTVACKYAAPLSAACL